MQVWIEWLKANPEAVLYAFLISRAIVKYTPTEIDNKIFAAILGPIRELAKVIGIVIPTDEPEVEKVIGKVIGDKPPIPIGIITDFKTGEVVPQDSRVKVDYISTGGAVRGRPLLRTMVRRIAARNGLDASKLTDSQIDEVIAEATHNAGPIKDLLSWIFANPETILAIIKVLLMVFAEEKQTVDPGVTT